MKENSYLEIKNYFENLVQQSKFLNDFVGFFSREWAEKKNTVKGLQEPVLSLWKYELGFDGPENNTIAVRKIGFAIMYNEVKADDLEAQYNAIHNAEALAIKVLSRIRHDNYDNSHFLYNSFIKESVEISPVELSRDEFGVEVTFNLKNKQLLQVHVEDWKDIPHECL